LTDLAAPRICRHRILVMDNAYATANAGVVW